MINIDRFTSDDTVDMDWGRLVDELPHTPDAISIVMTPISFNESESPLHSLWLGTDPAYNRRPGTMGSRLGDLGTKKGGVRSKPQ